MPSHSLVVCVLSELTELFKDDSFELHLFLYRFLDIHFFLSFGQISMFLHMPYFWLKFGHLKILLLPVFVD